MSIESWNAHRLDRYADALARGLHDDGCEQRERSSLCHCSKRKREAEGKTTLPTIHFASPWCSGCTNELDFDGDGWDCPTCKVSWPSNVGDGEQASYFVDDHGDIETQDDRWGQRLIVLSGGAA